MYPHNHTEESGVSSVSQMKKWRLKEVVIWPKVIHLLSVYLEIIRTNRGLCLEA